jgi:hypothetical protein
MEGGKNGGRYFMRAERIRLFSSTDCWDSNWGGNPEMGVSTSNRLKDLVRGADTEAERVSS